MDLEKLYKHAPGLIGTASLDGHFISLNDRWSQTLGYSLKELEGARFLDFVHPEDLPDTLSALQDLRGGQNVTHFVNRYRRQDGEFIAIEWHSTLGDDSQVYFFALVVTERMQMHQELVRSRDRLAQVADIAGIGGWEIDLSTMTPHWDQQTRAIHEVPDDYVPDLETAIDFYAPEAREMVASCVQKAVDEGTGWDFEAPLITAKGRRIWVKASGRTFQVNGVTVKLSGIFQDITDAKHRALELENALKKAEVLQATAEEATQAAESANQAKSSFLANMSHEIRTPLNGMMGMVQLLKRSPLSAIQSQYVDTLSDSGGVLRGLIDDILDISRIEAGQLVLTPEPFDLDALLDNTLAIIKPSAQAKGLSLDLKTDGIRFSGKRGDSKRLQQVLMNLLGNAVKFTQQGAITLTVRQKTTDRLYFEVQDTGPGIHPDAQRRIFDRFAQIDDSRRKEFEGVGLGLAISRELVEMAGGVIGVTSTPGQGARFWFEWPMADAILAHEDDAQKAKLTSRISDRPIGKKVLIAEDKDTNFIVLKAALENAGYEVERAHTGIEAVDLFQRWRPDLIMMDIHMPQMSGDEAIERIREEDEYGPEIFAVTADATPDTRERVQALGVQQIFLKPYDLEEITRAADKALSA